MGTTSWAVRACATSRGHRVIDWSLASLCTAIGDAVRASSALASDTPTYVWLFEAGAPWGMLDVLRPTMPVRSAALDAETLSRLAYIADDRECTAAITGEIVGACPERWRRAHVTLVRGRPVEICVARTGF